MGNVKRDQSIDEIIGNNLKEFRKIHKIERKELAEKFHISDDAVYRIERGETGLSGEYAYILANEYDCDMNFIYAKISKSEYILKSMENDMNTIKSSSVGKKRVMKLVSRILKFAAEALDRELEE